MQHLTSLYVMIPASIKISANNARTMRTQIFSKCCPQLLFDRSLQPNWKQLQQNWKTICRETNVKKVNYKSDTLNFLSVHFCYIQSVVTNSHSKANLSKLEKSICDRHKLISNSVIFSFIQSQKWNETKCMAFLRGLTVGNDTNAMLVLLAIAN